MIKKVGRQKSEDRSQKSQKTEVGRIFFTFIIIEMSKILYS